MKDFSSVAGEAAAEWLKGGRVKLSEHALDRIPERTGLPKRAAGKLASDALAKGARHGDYAGSMRRYLDGIFLQHRNANNMRIYNGQVFLFSGETLITCWPVPPKFRKHRPGKAHPGEEG